MTLTWRKDGVATALVAAAGALYWAYEAGTPVAGFGGGRVLSAGILIIGVAACAAAGGAPDTSARWQTLMGALGLVAFALGVAGMLAGSAIVVRATIGAVGGIWLLTTSRRAFTRKVTRPATAPSDADSRQLVGSGS
jgi:hypothetical protein